MELTKRDHFIQRETIRKTWSNKKLFLQMHVIFILGSSNDIQLDKKIEKESNRYNDIVQESFQDSYLNLTLKTIQGITWVSKYCSNAKYVLKVDDDVIVNSYSLLSYLENLKLNTSNNLLCFNHKNAPISRRSSSKFFVSYNEFKTNSYPQYCDGPAYMFQGNLAQPLYEASLVTKYFKFEDVYFGELAAKLNLNFIDLKYKYLYTYIKSFQMSQIDQFFESNKINQSLFIYPCEKNIMAQTWPKLVNIYSN